MTYPVPDEPVRRFRDVIAPPDHWPHTRGSKCVCAPIVESDPAGDVIVHRRYEGDLNPRGDKTRLRSSSWRYPKTERGTDARGRPAVKRRIEAAASELDYVTAPVAISDAASSRPRRKAPDQGDRNRAGSVTP